MEVSVVIPVYNAEKYLAEAVESALAQPETAQVILAEDGSPDHSLAVCQRLAEQHARVELLRHANGENRGAGATRNLGLEAVRHEYTAFLDADDFFLPNRFREARDRFEGDPTIAGVYETVGSIYENPDVEKWWLSGGDGMSGMTEATDPNSLFEVMLKGEKGEICTNGIVVRTDLIRRTGDFDPSLRMCQDTAMWLKMAAKGRLVAGLIKEPVAMRRLHGENRIYLNRDRHLNNQILMAKSILRWAHAEGLSDRRIAALLDYMLIRQLRLIDRRSPYLLRKTREMAFLFRFALRYPMAVRSERYREIICHTSGWRRCIEPLEFLSKRPSTKGGS